MGTGGGGWEKEAEEEGLSRAESYPQALSPSGTSGLRGMLRGPHHREATHSPKEPARLVVMLPPPQTSLGSADGGRAGCTTGWRKDELTCEAGGGGEGAGVYLQGYVSDINSKSHHLPQSLQQP